ncbi:vigilin-like [Mizuhopecten yessoensis]|uniref:vigilin-like n=1 Tax=Mizuhopecten yessoensis TaxID=6573 RepID=UPI000B459CC4|nr:vigilin-like [Mizuhopecten yessoensis]
MAGCLVIRARGYRLLNSGLASFGSICNAKCLFQDLGYKFKIPRPCSSLTRNGKAIQRPVISKPRAIVGRLNYNYSTTSVATGEQGTSRIINDRKHAAKVVTDSDADVHRLICGFLIGRDGENIKKLRLETGFDFDLDTKTNRDPTGPSLLVFGTDSEVLKSATEKITEEVQKIRNCLKKVFTDEDVDIHYEICKLIIGEGGQNIQRLKLETGLDFELSSISTGLLVIGTDAIVLQSATEKVTQEVQRIRNCIEKVFTDEDVDIHACIAGNIIGKGGQNIQRLKMETGLDFELYSITKGLLVIGTDAEMLKSATEQVTREVQRMRNCIEKVLTDEDVDIHNEIYSSIIGKGGQNKLRLKMESGLDFDLSRISTGLLVSVTDAEVLKSATEKVTQEVQRIRNCMEKVFTDEDINIHTRICSGIIGKRGQNIQRLKLETGLDFELEIISTGLLVHVTDAEVLTIAIEQVTREVQRMRNCIEKVFTDEDVDIHANIVRNIIGIGGHNKQRLKMESGLDFELDRISTGLLVRVTDSEVLKSATEKVTQEVQRIRNCIEKVFTDEDVDIHACIVRNIIGKGGQNIQRLQLVTGLDFELDSSNTGLLVRVTDAEMLKSATEQVTKEVQRRRNCIEKVFTDEDVDIHAYIVRNIIGKGGQNIQRLKLESGLDFELDCISTGLLVHVTDAEVLKSATENVTQEVQRIKNRLEKN